MKILIVDSDETIRLATTEILIMKGFYAESVISNLEAFSLIKNDNSFDKIVTSQKINQDFPIPIKFLEKPYTAQQLLDTIYQ